MIVRIALSALLLHLTLSAQMGGAQEPLQPKQGEPKDAAKSSEGTSGGLRIGQKAKPIELTSMDGKTKFSLKEALKGKDGKPGIVVITCWSSKCPVSKGLDSTVQKIADDYAPKGVTTVGICSCWPGNENAKGIAAYCEGAGVKFPILDDQKQEVAKEYGFVTTPDVFVIDSTGTLVYRGLVKETKGGDTEHLRNALDAVLAGKPVPVPFTKPQGCQVKFDGGAPEWFQAANAAVREQALAPKAKEASEKTEKSEKSEPPPAKKEKN